MYHSIVSLVPKGADLLALEVEELAGVLLTHLNSYSDVMGSPVAQHGRINRHDFFNRLEHTGHQEKVNRALLEAWSWLQGEGFLVTDPGPDWFFISRRGQRLKSRAEFGAYRKAALLPKGQLHPLIAHEVYPAFLRGKYDTAIFEAFRELEVAVREAAGFGLQACGTDLMRDAFRPAAKNNQPVTPGPLTDIELPIAEQEAMANLFAGAIGFYKNPQSHRHVPTRAEEAAEVIVFASQLLRIVDGLRPKTSVQP